MCSDAPVSGGGLESSAMVPVGGGKQFLNVKKLFSLLSPTCSFLLLGTHLSLNMEEEFSVPKIPNLELAQWKFLLSSPHASPALKEEAKTKLIEAIKADSTQVALTLDDFLSVTLN